MHKNLLHHALIGALLISFATTTTVTAQTEWIAELGFDEMPSPDSGHSFRFSLPTDPVLVQLASEARLDSILRPTEPDLEKVKKITHHLHSLVRCDPKLAFFSKNGHDPLAIFRAARSAATTDEASLATVLSAFLTAKGFPARLLYLQKKDGSDSPKVIVEAWLRDSQRWAVCDAGLDFVPGEKGHPLSAVELLKSCREKSRPYNMVEGSETSDKKFEKAVKPYLFGFCAPLDQRFLGENDGIATPDSCLLLKPKNSEHSQKHGAGGEGEKVFLTHSLADFYRKPD